MELFLEYLWALVRATVAGCAYTVSLGFNIAGASDAISMHAYYAGVFGSMVVRSLLCSPQASLSATILSPVLNGRPCWKHILAVRLGDFRGVRRHIVRVSMKSMPHDGWDDLV